MVGERNLGVLGRGDILAITGKFPDREITFTGKEVKELLQRQAEATYDTMIQRVESSIAEDERTALKLEGAEEFKETIRTKLGLL